MNILIVYAHHEPTSFTAALKNTALQTLGQQGHNVVVSDLYGEGFNPVAQKWDFVTTSGGHFNYMLEQRHAARLEMSFSPDISGEIQKVQAADVVMFISPLWWFSVPAILKGWFDRVLAMGVAWDGGKFYDKGLMRGKQAMMVMAAGHPADYYQTGGVHKQTITQVLQPINYGTLAFCGFNVHDPFVASNVLGMSSQELEKTMGEFNFRLQNLIASPQWLHYFG